MIELTVRISDFDYSSALDEFLPEILESMQNSGDLNALVRMACNSPETSAKVIKGLLAAMPQRKKEQVLVKLINSNDDKIVEKLNTLASEAGVSVKVESAKAANW